MRAQRLALLLLVVGAGQRRDVAAALVAELDGDVAEAADADDADAVTLADLVLAEGRPSGDSRAQKRCRVDGIEAFRDREGPLGVAADGVRETTIPTRVYRVSSICCL